MSSVQLSSCCSCFVFRQWFALKWVKFSAILYSLPKQLNLIPRSSRSTVQFPVNFPARLMWSLQYRKILPNLVDSSWLWWIMHGILANQKQRNILHEYYLINLLKQSSACTTAKRVLYLSIPCYFSLNKIFSQFTQRQLQSW